MACVFCISKEGVASTAPGGRPAGCLPRWLGLPAQPIDFPQRAAACPPPPPPRTQRRLRHRQRRVPAEHPQSPAKHLLLPGGGTLQHLQPAPPAPQPVGWRWRRRHALPLALPFALPRTLPIAAAAQTSALAASAVGRCCWQGKLGGSVCHHKHAIPQCREQRERCSDWLSLAAPNMPCPVHAWHVGELPSTPRPCLCLASQAYHVDRSPLRCWWLSAADPYPVAVYK